MKKIITSIGLSLLGITALIAAGGTGFTGSPAASVVTVSLTAGVPQIILTNNVTVQQVQFITGSASSLISFYDCPSTNSPFLGYVYTNNSYISFGGYATNYVTSYTGYNGYTNYYTNTGWWTFSVTNAAGTNVLAPQGVFAAVSGAITSVNNPMSFQLGVSVIATSNTTAVVYYTPNK